MPNLIRYQGKIVFEPEHVTRKHELQSEWKRTALILFDGDMCEYYAWFLKKRFSLHLIKPLRGSHVTFINDRFEEMSGESIEDKDSNWKSVIEKWDNQEIDVVLNTNVFTSGKHWWLNVDHSYRDEIHNIRAELGLIRPYFGLHLTIGHCNESNLEFSNYIKVLHNKGYIELNDYVCK